MGWDYWTIKAQPPAFLWKLQAFLDTKAEIGSQRTNPGLTDTIDK